MSSVQERRNVNKRYPAVWNPAKPRFSFSSTFNLTPLMGPMTRGGRSGAFAFVGVGNLPGSGRFHSKSSCEQVSEQLLSAAAVPKSPKEDVECKQTAL